MTASTSADYRAQRLARLTLKELREILRDRRTIVTLVLMPLLMYPLLSIAFQQFFVSQLSTAASPRYTIGFQSERDARIFKYLLAKGGLRLLEIEEHSSPVGDGQDEPVVEGGVHPRLQQGLEDFEVHVGLRITNMTPDFPYDPDGDLVIDVELLYRPDSVTSREAATFIEKRLADASEKFLEARLKRLEVTQRAVPVRTVRRAVNTTDAPSGTVSITAVVPFILILMTVTGAVYPAIDLTAGERERGTLEILVAAPIPRIGVLLAKYVAVLSVALLTAAANLLTMTITIAVSGVGRLLFGDAGISPGVLAAMFGLLLLFAAFFSAVLLVITSTARSFKEAQAYLIPLMLVSLAPGMLSLIPGVELSGLLLVTPLANIVLLGRDLLAYKASGAAMVVVVGSTLLYAAAAIALAARIFGAESVLYSSQSGWSDLFRRPREPRGAPSVTAACLCLALMFPAYFVFFNVLSRAGNDTVTQLTLGVVMTVIVFGGFPLAASWAQRVRVGQAIRLLNSSAVVFFPAIVLGLSFWTLDHELVIFSKQLRGVTLDTRVVAALIDYVNKLRELPVPVVVLAMAVVPALFEEVFFRGYLFAALRSRMTGPATILATAIVFGLFHAIAPNPLASERFVSSTLMGLVLGWVRWRTGSLAPGVLLHALHNGLLVLLVYYEPTLTSRRIGISQTQHLPTDWINCGATAAFVGLVAMYFATRRGAAADESA